MRMSVNTSVRVHKRMCVLHVRMRVHVTVLMVTIAVKTGQYTVACTVKT